MKVSIHLKETSQPFDHTAEAAYTKGPFYCVKVGERVYKYPLANIWRVAEDYGESQREAP
jgi:hypothetical protein